MKKYSFGLLFVIALFGLLYVGRALLIPLVLAVFIAYLIKVLSDTFVKLLAGEYFKRLEDRSGKPIDEYPKVLRVFAFFTALVTIAAALYFSSRLIMKNISEVAAAAPAYQYNLELVSRRLLTMIPWHEPLTISGMIGDIDIAAMARIALREVTGIFSRGTIVAVYLLFLFLEQRSFKNKLAKLFPESDRQKEVSDIIGEIDSDIRKYMGIKAAASSVTALLSYVVFRSVDLNFASFWAFLMFIFNFIPTVGSIVATILPALLALVQFESIAPFLIILICVTTVQMLIGNILEPRIQGDNLNLSPLVILLSLALWNSIWGITGMFLCVPMTAVALIICSHFESTKKIAIALSRNGKIGADAREEAAAKAKKKTAKKY